MLTNIIYHFLSLHIPSHFNLYNFSPTLFLLNPLLPAGMCRLVYELELMMKCRGKKKKMDLFVGEICCEIIFYFNSSSCVPSLVTRHIIIGGKIISIRTNKPTKSRRENGSYLQLDFVFLHIPQIYYYSFRSECWVSLAGHDEICVKTDTFQYDGVFFTLQLVQWASISHLSSATLMSVSVFTHSLSFVCLLAV